MTPEMKRLMMNTQAQANVTYLDRAKEKFRLLVYMEKMVGQDTVDVPIEALEDWVTVATASGMIIADLIKDQQVLLKNYEDVVELNKELKLQLDQAEGKA